MKWKRFFCWMGTVILVPYAFWFTLMRPKPTDYIRCDLYTNRMNGGVKTFQGQEYKIELCGLNGGIDPSNWHYDEIRLHVYSMEGELLAERFYEPLLGMRYGMQLDYGENYLIYNDGEGSGYQTKMTMPPSRIERIRAKLPRMWP